MTGKPGVTGAPGEPSVVGAPGLPGVVGETGHRSFDRYRVLLGPGVTGTCSECTGGFTGDC